MSERCVQVEPLLSAWLDRALKAQEWAQVGSHLAGCPRCRAELESLRVTAALLRGAPLRTPPRQVSALVDSGVAAGGVIAGRPPVSRGLVRRLAVAALSVLGLLGATAYALGDPDSSVQPVTVPLETFVADHLVRTTSPPLSSPGLFEVGR